MNKQAVLDTVTREIESCKICPVGKSGKPVPGEGSPDADVVFVGEAPGKTEAATGRPFVGRSGKLLRSLIAEIGLDEKKIYITSPVKYLPDRGTPSKKDIAHGRIHLEKQLDIIDSKLIVLMGSVATQGVLQSKIPVKTEHGKMIEKDGKKYFITVHPAAALRFPPFRKIIQEDFQKLQKQVSK